MWGGKRILHYQCDDYGEVHDDAYDDDDDEHGDDNDRKMRMWMLRRRKMIMLGRKTDPRTGKHTLPEPAQARCTWTGYKSHFVWIFSGKTTGDTSGDTFLCEPAQSKRT